MEVALSSTGCLRGKIMKFKSKKPVQKWDYKQERDKHASKKL